MIKNLCVFLCQDESQTPIFSKSITKQVGILSFNKTLATAVSVAPIRTRDEPVDEPIEGIAAKIMRRGGIIAFQQLAATFGSDLFRRLPKLWQCISEELFNVYPASSNPDSGDNILEGGSGQAFLDTLTALRDVVPTVDGSLLHRVQELFPSLLLGLQSRFAVVRQAVAKTFAIICEILTPETMLYVVERALTLVDDANSLTNRQGGTELVFRTSIVAVSGSSSNSLADIVNVLQLKALPYVMFLIVPLLGRMSDPDEDIRTAATNSFATLIKMVPLDVRLLHEFSKIAIDVRQGGLPDPPGFPEQLLRKRDEERKFLSQLLDGSQIEDYALPVKINAELRKYQQEGVNWLAFLRKYQLHGILCDGRFSFPRKTPENSEPHRHGPWKDSAVDLHPIKHSL